MKTQHSLKATINENTNKNHKMLRKNETKVASVQKKRGNDYSYIINN